MHTAKLCGTCLVAVVGCFGLGAFAQGAKTLDRPWQPVVLDAGAFPELHATPVEHIHVFAYRSSPEGGVWERIPFQIDEKDSADYFSFPHNRVFDGFDQLVFMARDMGDQAPPEAWVDDVASRGHPRIEIEVRDGLDPTQKAWAYLYVSSSLASQPSFSYGLSVNWKSPDSNWVETNAYAVGFAPSGLIGDARIKPEGGGTGVHLVDTQKLRMVGPFRHQALKFYLGKTGNPPGNERDFFRRVPDSTKVIGGEVRVVVREWVQLWIMGVMPLPVGFPLTTYFYPYSVSFGGAIDSTSMPADTEIWLDLVRQSLDLTPQAQGMRFYNAYNSDGLLVDGVPDSPVTTLQTPGLDWAMVTGEQGTIVTLTRVPRLGSQQQLYYWDNVSGGSADGTHQFLWGGDTGDGVSYGDFGYMFTGDSFGVALSFELTGYFLPGNQQPSVGEALRQWTAAGIVVNVAAQTYTSAVGVGRPGGAPGELALHQNFPNPFNPQTVLRVELPVGVGAELRILDSGGRLVRRFDLRGGSPGVQEVVWDGRNEHGAELPSGVYVAVLRSQAGVASRKVLLVR